MKTMADSKMAPLRSLVVSLLLMGLGTQYSQAQSSPPTPVFADNYHVHGVLSLPYAELNEPFNAYYDKQLDRSRADYYGGEYKVYQFGPKSSPATSEGSQFGSIYKFVYVPKGFHEQKQQPNDKRWQSKLINEAFNYATGRLHAKKTIEKLNNDNDNDDDDDSAANSKSAEQDFHIKTSRTPIKRVCFGVNGGVGNTIQAQTVLPDLSNFKYDSTGKCPLVVGGEHRRANCELWKYSNEVGAKKNTYKFWLRRDSANNAIPVHYYMLGFDSLLGSHYDRYDITYWNYRVNGTTDDDFKLIDVERQQCGSMPGPGAGSSGAEIRAHLIVQNPIHQYVVTPHVYDHIDHHYAEFKSKFGSKTTTTTGDDKRGWFNFLHNLRFIHGKNRQLKEYKLDVNKFADQDVANLKYLRGRLRSKQGHYNGGLDYEQHHRLASNGATSDLPEYFDWTTLGGVTPVKDQAVCGSCWSFGTVGTIEGNYFAKTGKLLRLSQQQLVDCSWQFGNNGCDGGEDFRAYAYVMKAGGLATEEDYGHYKGIDGKCHDEDVEKPVKISGFYNVTVNSVEALKHALVNYGPVSISIDASRPTFTFYSHGAYFDEKCANSPDSLDHSVLVVGYTKINDKLVWKVKNSWSTYWGNDGYIYMLAEKNNCGVLDAPTVPIIANSL